MNQEAVAIIGAGTMGAGIAQVAATAGWDVHLMDMDEATVTLAIKGIGKRLDRLVEKERIDAASRDAIAARLHVATQPDDAAHCALVIEAVVEDERVKREVLGRLLAVLDPKAIIATNTSSLSVSSIGNAIDAPERTVGMHFFNPAPIMKLVEIISGDQTADDVVDRVEAIAQAWGKRTARAADVPGFIVNHVARPYYLEAFRLLEEGIASVEEIDLAMRDATFRMGPLELTDFIGQDVNTATTRSVWERLGRPPLLAPSRLQEQLVTDGRLGRKVGRGVYDYDRETPKPALVVPVHEIDYDDARYAHLFPFAQAALGDRGEDADPRTQHVVGRILGALIAQAEAAVDRGIATPSDIDTALRYGANYPHGPLEWRDLIGRDLCDAWIAESGIGGRVVEARG